MALLHTLKHEIEFTAGVWTDVSADVAGEQPQGGHFGRPGEFSDVGAAMWSLTLRNDTGNYTPDSPLSTYYPNIIEGRRLRVTVTDLASVARQQFLGYITAWEPSYPAQDGATGVVQVSAVDGLGIAKSMKLRCIWVERARDRARTLGTWLDVFLAPSTATGTSNVLENSGFTTSATALGSAKVVPAGSGAGEWAVEDDDTLTLGKVIHLQPSSEVGPLIKVVPQASPQSLDIWLKIPPTTTVTSPAVLGVVDLWNGSTGVGSLRIYDNFGAGINLGWYDATGTGSGTLHFGINDGKWHRIRMRSTPGTPTTTDLAKDGSVVMTVAMDFRTVTLVYLGGLSNGYSEGKQNRCAEMFLAAPTMVGDTLFVTANIYGVLGSAWAGDIWANIQGWAPGLWSTSASVPTGATVGSDTQRPLWLRDTTDRTLLDFTNELARSVNAVFWSDRAGVPTMTWTDAARSKTPICSIDVEADCAGAPTLSRAVDSSPTRVTVTYPAGTITVTDTAAEAAVTGQRRDDQVQTMSYAADDATAVAQARLRRSKALRVTQITVDLLTATTAGLWAALLTTMVPGSRVRLTNLPASLGYTRTDAYVAGWDLSFTQDSATVTLDLSPADTPVEGVYDDAEYGRYSAVGTMTVTSGTAVGTTGNGTLVVTTASGPTLTTDAGAYPLDLDWNGERVTITSAPAGSASPQTVTTTSRGVAPTIARVHVAGEQIDVWHGAAYTF